jgi:hypothetical protein
MAEDIVYKRTYTALRIHAFRQQGYLSVRALHELNMPTTPEVLADVLTRLQAENLLIVRRNADGIDVGYDFLPFLEKAVQESQLDMDTRFQLANIYLAREMWTSAIAELRITQLQPKFKCPSLYLLGQCFEQKGAFEKAREHYERLLAMDYFYQDAADRLARLTAQTQQTTIITTTETTSTAQQQVNAAAQARYEIVRELGRGGAGVVYLAIDLKLKRDVALKIFYRPSQADAPGASDFLQEARFAAQMEHVNIIKVYDVNVAGPLIIMEYVDGGTLRDILKKHRTLSVNQARALILQLCQGLAVAHQAGILHRDIKPENIFITRQKQVKLGDFGVAHHTTQAHDAFTQLAAQIGTLPYMSPEQVRGTALSPASDIYAVGIVFYEILTGAPPFLQGDITYHHLYSPPPPLKVSPTIDALILRCLAKNPAARLQAVTELQRALKQQQKEEQQRQEQYRALLKMALIDKEISGNEILVLKLKRQMLQISDAEARQIEQELGLNIPD